MKRGFELINEKGIIPTRATMGSAGYDFYLPEDITLLPHETKLIPTYIKAFMESDEVLLLTIRSSVAIKRHLVLANQIGIIDSDYYQNPDNDGHIKIALYNQGTETIHLVRNERIVQGIFTNYLTTDQDVAHQSRKGGFGSSND